MGSYDADELLAGYLGCLGYALLSPAVRIYYRYRMGRVSLKNHSAWVIRR